jgi:hypothetical protein
MYRALGTSEKILTAGLPDQWLELSDLMRHRAIKPTAPLTDAIATIIRTL